MKLKYIFGAVLLFGIVAIGVVVSQLGVGKSLCENFRQGVWASNGGYCITTDCYDNGTCLRRVYPAIHCGSVAVGDHISKIYLHLGNPKSNENGLLKWYSYKIGDEIGVEARIENDRLVHIDCPLLPSS